MDTWMPKEFYFKDIYQVDTPIRGYVLTLSGYVDTQIPSD